MSCAARTYCCGGGFQGVLCGPCFGCWLLRLVLSPMRWDDLRVDTACHDSLGERLLGRPFFVVWLRPAVFGPVVGAVSPFGVAGISSAASAAPSIVDAAAAENVLDLEF